VTNGRSSSSGELNDESAAVLIWQNAYGTHDQEHFDRRFGARASYLETYVSSVIRESKEIGDAHVESLRNDTWHPPGDSVHYLVPDDVLEGAKLQISACMRAAHPELADPAIRELVRIYDEGWGHTWGTGPFSNAFARLLRGMAIFASWRRGEKYEDNPWK
jgi:hypothetical protein